MKTIDRFVNSIVIRYGGNFIVWSTFSFTKWFFTFGGRYLRADYIDFTADRYTENVKYSKKSDWVNKLENDIHLKEYFKL